MRYSATILSVTGPCDFSRLKGYHEQLRRDRWNKRATNDSGAPPVEGILCVVLPVDAREDGNSVVALSFLP